MLCFPTASALRFQCPWPRDVIPRLDVSRPSEAAPSPLGAPFLANNWLCGWARAALSAQDLAPILTVRLKDIIAKCPQPTEHTLEVGDCHGSSNLLMSRAS
jgi:hypothetical protein